MSDPNTGTPGRDTMDRMKDATREGAEAVRHEAAEGARGIRDEAAAAYEEVKQQGASVLETAQQRVGEFAEEGKDAGVRQAEGLARAIHRAADEIQDSAPWMARYVHEAAESVDGMARSIRDRRPREIIGSLESLARRQPVAFFGAAALAGFALARFARSSPPRRGAHLAGSGHDDETDLGGGTHRSGTGSMSASSPTSRVVPSTGAPGWQSDEAGRARPATMAAASLGGAAARPSSVRGATRVWTARRAPVAGDRDWTRPRNIQHPGSAAPAACAPAVRRARPPSGPTAAAAA